MVKVNVELYVKSNIEGVHFYRKPFDDFSNIFKWRSDRPVSVLEAGCGPGTMGFEVVMPMLPPNFKRFVGIDISEESIDYARKTCVHPKVSFELFDLDIELEKQSFNYTEPFDHIISNFCLMEVKNEKVCYQNFYKLLNPGGDMLLSFLAYSPVYDAYKHLSQDKRWAEYMKDVDQVIPSYQLSTDPRLAFQNLLEGCGFADCDVRVQDNSYIYDTKDIPILRNLYRSFDPFIGRIPDKMKEAYIDDMFGYFVQKNYVLTNMPLKFIEAYARKPTNATNNN